MFERANSKLLLAQLEVDFFSFFLRNWKTFSYLKSNFVIFQCALFFQAWHCHLCSLWCKRCCVSNKVFNDILSIFCTTTTTAAAAAAARTIEVMPMTKMTVLLSTLTTVTTTIPTTPTNTINGNNPIPVNPKTWTKSGRNNNNIDTDEKKWL